eukprot:455581-Pyramimonas_sp.AAC.1
MAEGRPGASTARGHPPGSMTELRANPPYGPGGTSETVHIKQPSKTFLEDGGNSILIDVGSQVNIMGENTSRKFVQAAEAHGCSCTFDPRSRLNINGVGEGSAPADTVGTFRIACECQGSTQLDSYKTNIVRLWQGLASHPGPRQHAGQARYYVLERGQEKLIFPGKGQVKMEPPEGSKIMPTTKLPSGHLSI